MSCSVSLDNGFAVLIDFDDRLIIRLERQLSRSLNIQLEVLAACKLGVVLFSLNLLRYPCGIILRLSTEALSVFTVRPDYKCVFCTLFKIFNYCRILAAFFIFYGYLGLVSCRSVGRLVKHRISLSIAGSLPLESNAVVSPLNSLKGTPLEDARAFMIVLVDDIPGQESHQDKQNEPDSETLSLLASRKAVKMVNTVIYRASDLELTRLCCLVMRHLLFRKNRCHRQVVISWCRNYFFRRHARLIIGLQIGFLIILYYIVLRHRRIISILIIQQLFYDQFSQTEITASLSLPGDWRNMPLYSLSN